MLLMMSGEELFTKLTTPETNCVSQVLAWNVLRSMTGEEPFPPIAAPNPPAPCALLRKTFRVIVADAKESVTPAPKEAFPCWMVNPVSADCSPSPV